MSTSCPLTPDIYIHVFTIQTNGDTMSGYAGGIRSDLPATYSAAGGLSDRYSLQPPLPALPTSDRPYSTQSCDYFFYSPQRQRREYQTSLTRSNSFSSIHTRRVYSAQPRRMANTIRASNRSAILAVGEELRQLLHAEDDPPVLKDRRYHLKTYATCFIGHEMVDWLLKKGEVESRSEAVAMMQKLLENEVIHHGKGERGERKQSHARDILVM